METIIKMQRTGANGSQQGANLGLFSIGGRSNQLSNGGRHQFGRTGLLNGRTRRFAPTVLLMVALILGGCSKDDDDLNKGKTDSFNGTVTAKVENGSSYESQISTVWALYDAEVNSSGELRGRILSSGDYTKGGFSITLPDIPSSFLVNVQTFFGNGLNIDGELEYSEPDAQVLDADFFAITEDNEYLDYFIYTNAAAKRTTCLFIFSDSNVTIKGGKDINVSLRKGWNRIFLTPADNKIVSTAPSGMKWYLHSALN